MKTQPVSTIGELRELVIAAWTGRDEVALRKYIRELEEIGIMPPKRTPMFYRAPVLLLTTADEIEVSDPNTSGEVEFVLLMKSDGLAVTVGSDHTDRTAERTSVSLAKQLCAKVIANDAWAYDDVKRHWHELVLRSWSDGELYQEGPVTVMRSPEDLIDRYPLKTGGALFCGSLPAKGGVRPAKMFRMELEDPVRRRKLTHQYRIAVLPPEA